MMSNLMGDASPQVLLKKGARVDVIDSRCASTQLFALKNDCCQSYHLKGWCLHLRCFRFCATGRCHVMVRPFPAPSESSANADSHDGSGKLFQPPRGRTALHYATLGTSSLCTYLRATSSPVLIRTCAAMGSGGHLDTVEVLIKAEHEQVCFYVW